MTYLEFVTNYSGTGNQKHHIIPQSIQRKKNGAVTDERVVFLSPAAHLYAHILYDIENGTYTSRYMRNVSGLNKKTLTEITYKDCLAYNNLKEQSDHILEGCDGYWKGKQRSKETKQRMSEAKKGKPKSEETKRKMSEAWTPERRQRMSEIQSSRKRESLTEEVKKKISEAHEGKPNCCKGTKWYNNGVDSKRFIPGTEPVGYVPGRILQEIKDYDKS